MATSTRSHDLADDVARQLDATRRDLVAEFADRLSEDEVTARFDAVARAFQGAAVRTFVPVLVGRAARVELRGPSA